MTHKNTPEELIQKGNDIEARVLARSVRWHAEKRILINAKKTIVFGEVGLSGEIRAVSHIATRLKEAEKLGFTSVASSPMVRSSYHADQQMFSN